MAPAESANEPKTRLKGFVAIGQVTNTAAMMKTAVALAPSASARRSPGSDARLTLNYAGGLKSMLPITSRSGRAARSLADMICSCWGHLIPMSGSLWAIARSRSGA